MARAACWLPLVGTLLLCPVAARAAGQPSSDAAGLAATIDRLLAERWAAAGVEPAPAAGDAEFLRRVSLSLTGKIPSVAAARDFLAETGQDKRRRLVDRLLQSRAYVSHFTNVWRAILLPEKGAEDPDLRAGFEAWLRARIAANAGYDRMVREILTASAGRARGNAFGGFDPNAGQLTPVGFDQANENKPENLAGSTARLFLGVRLECAQCHKHPFARWRREQFWAYAAFFTPRPPSGKAPSIAIPTMGKVVEARFLDGSAPAWTDGTAPRAALAGWILAPANPYFARTAVNRVWAHFFGVGLVEPVDDLTQETGPNPLLDELAQHFVAHGYDLKDLIRGIVNSRAYGLSSRQTHRGRDNPRLFARMPVRGLAPEQIFDSLVEATRHEVAGGTARAEFLKRFANPADRPTEVQTSMLQALALMNGRVVADATSLERSTTLQAVAEAPFLDTAGRVEALYLAALTRKPRHEESARLVKYVESGGPSGDRKQALADVFWALLNSSEFLFNH
jgi:hypothetical protein